MSDEEFVQYIDCDDDSNDNDHLSANNCTSDNDSSDSDDSSDENFVSRSGQEKLEILKSMREKVDWNIPHERQRFLWRIYPLIIDWHEQLPDFRSIFRPEEIDWLLMDFIKFDASVVELAEFIQFVNKTGYKDQFNEDEDGKPRLRRTTPLHQAFQEFNISIIPNLFKIYDRFDTNYTDEFGLTHFHVACLSGCYDVVEKFLELGQDPNLLAQESVDPPLHLALKNNHETVFKLLLKYGADPNLIDMNGMSPLHIISESHYLHRFVEMIFDIKEHQMVQVDARDNLGRTPLQLAVANIAPDMVDVLLDHGADLSGFVFPTENQFDEGLELRKSKVWLGLDKLQIATEVLEVVEYLKKRAYELDKSDALTIMKTLNKHVLFDTKENLEFWRSDEDFVTKAKELMMNSTLSLYDLIGLRPDKAKKLLTNTDYFKFASWNQWRELPAGSRRASITHLCEKKCRGFFRQWALDSFLELTRYRLPILCCDIIIENLMNEDLLRVCLAADIVANEKK